GMRAMAPTVFLADDHTLVRDGMVSLLERAGMEVVGQAANGREAVKLVAQLKPDVVVMDVAMPEMNGIEATRQIRADNPEAIILMVSMHADRRYIFEALRAGASGYLLKDAAFDELVVAIRQVLVRQPYFGKRVSELVMEDYVRRASGERTDMSIQG